MAPFSSLTEGCIAKIISLTSPRYACWAAAVSHEFKSAAESNTVWDCFLPPDYQEKISASSNPRLPFSSKKELYFMLCAGLLLHQGRLFFRLNKSSGKKCYMFCAKELRIAWGSAPEYWSWIHDFPESRFNEVAELLEVCWLDISVSFYSGLLSPNTNYAAYLVFKLRDDPKLHIPIMAVVRKTTEVEENIRIVYIVPPINEGWVGRNQMRMPHIARRRKDGWMEIELGEFFVPKDDIFNVDCMIYEHDDHYWKRGLIVEGIEVRPKEAFALAPMM